MTETKTTEQETPMTQPDPLATMTAEEYRKVRDQLRREGLWEVSDDPRREDRSNRRATEYLLRDLR